MGNDKETLLGFFTPTKTVAQDGYLGAILIINQQGVPQEFRCTHPVKPTAIQKPLYGDVLEPYIGVDLCGVHLVRSLHTKPSLILVPREFLLDIRNSCPCPVL